MKKLEFVLGLGKGVATNVIIRTIPAMRKTNNPYVGRVEKVTNYTGVQLGTSYNNSVANSISRSGSTEEFVVAKPNGKHYINDFLLQSDKDDTKYLQMQYTKKMLNHNLVTVNSFLLIDGKKATIEEENAIKSFCSSNNGSKKQENSGVTKEEQRIYICPKLDNVIYIKQGGAIWQEQ